MLFIKNSIFGKNIHPWWNFDLFWTFFIHRLRPYLLTIWDPFEPIWTLLDHFRQKWFFALNGQSRVWRKCSMNKKIVFVLNFLKESRWAQKGHKWSKTLGLTILVPFRPFWTKLGHSQSWTVDPKVKKGSSMKNVKNRSIIHEKNCLLFWIYLAMNGKLWVWKKCCTHIYDLIKVSWKSDAWKC